MKRLLQIAGLLFVLGIGVPSFAGTWTRVNGCGQETATTNSANCVVTGTSAGDFMLVGSGCATSNTNETVAVSDGANTFNVLTGGTNGLAWNGTTDRAWSHTSVLTTGGSRTVTVAFTGTGTCNFHDIWVDVWHNTAGVGTINTAATATGTGNAATVNITSVGSNDLVVGFFSTNGATIAAGAGYTLGANGSGSSVAFGNEYKLGVAAGTQTVNATLTGATAWGAHAVSVQEGAGGGGGTIGASKSDKLNKMYAALKKPSGMGAIVSAVTPADQIDGVFTWRADLTHQSADTKQTILNTTNVTGTSFKKVWQFATADADIKTQPLVVTNLKVGNGPTRNVVYIASMGNTAYALDADNGTLLWKSDLNTGEAPANAVDVMSCADVVGTVGVISSGVIDANSRTIYYLAKTEVAGPTFKYRLHALDLLTGAEKFGAPVLVTATVAGTGAGSVGGNISLDPHHNNNTSGAVIANGLLYLTFSSHCDDVPYHGWILAYDPKTLQQKYVWANAPNSGTGTSKEGGPWMSGAPPAIDELGNLYVTTGCADWNGTDAFGQSLIKLSPTLTVKDFFTPFDWSTFNTNDYDLGASGVLLLPDQPGGPPRLVVHGGKAHNLYVESRDNLGGNHASDNNQITQYLAATFPGTDNGDHGMFATPLYWNGRLYFCIADLVTPRGCQMRTITNGVVASSASSTTGDVCHVRTCGGYITSTGLTNGIFWMYDNDTVVGHARLYAYDATNLATKLYDSEANAARDACPMGGSKWTNPTVYNGKAYIVGTSGICAYANF